MFKKQTEEIKYQPLNEQVERFWFKRTDNDQQNRSKLGLFADAVKKDYQGASAFNRVSFAVGALGFVAGTILFACSCACGLGPICTLIGFAMLLAGAVIAGLILYKNHKEVNKPLTTFAERVKNLPKKARMAWETM